MKNIILFFAFAVLCLAACKKDDSTAAKIQQSLYAGVYTGQYTDYFVSTSVPTPVDAGIEITDVDVAKVNIHLTVGTQNTDLTATITNDNKLVFPKQLVFGKTIVSGSGELFNVDQQINITLNSTSDGALGGFFKGKK